MAKRKKSKSNSQSVGTSSQSEEAGETVRNGRSSISEYEEQRLRRIAENQARLKALGLPQMASSLKTLPQINKKKGKEKEKVEGDDEEYRPENEEERETESDSSSEHESDFENASGSRKRKAKNKSLKVKSRVAGKKHGGNLDNVDDEDEALMQAIALSLQNSAEPSVCSNMNVGNISKAEKKENIHTQEDKEQKKNKKSFISRLQMTEDELIVHFFQLDEAGKGTVTIRDLERAAITHDFAWTDNELVDMIRCFDSDGDGRLSLEDFRKIAVRCNMIKDSQNS
ncbi:unnamed protein product [Lathyrus oleraceus]|uniref:EF-hand domain-containing protein n=1 Tax=Pisum sativum TaxID=3888 RepID=A0A9D5A2A6_PEA|nr:uncharacterized protein LOC127108189 [Pisum sativum]KAI5391523.1 hypothetical protein KIW84_076365 [Pisum sativum]